LPNRWLTYFKDALRRVFSERTFYFISSLEKSPNNQISNLSVEITKKFRGSETSEITQKYSGMSILYGKRDSSFMREEVLADIFEETCQNFSQKKCLIFEHQKLTYSAVNQMANIAAINLTKKGAGAGKIVGLWISRGINLLVMQLAIVKSGTIVFCELLFWEFPKFIFFFRRCLAPV
jgi:hypothetical protein